MYFFIFFVCFWLQVSFNSYYCTHRCIKTFNFINMRKSLENIKWYSEAATQRCSYEKVFWKNAPNLQENTHPEVRLCTRSCNFIEIIHRHACSPVNLLHIFRTPFLKNTFGWLLLNIWFLPLFVLLLQLLFIF